MIRTSLANVDLDLIGVGRYNEPLLKPNVVDLSQYQRFVAFGQWDRNAVIDWHTEVDDGGCTDACRMSIEPDGLGRTNFLS